MTVAVGTCPSGGQTVDVVLLDGDRVVQGDAGRDVHIGCKGYNLQGLPLAVEFLRLAGRDDAHIVSGGRLETGDVTKAGGGQNSGVEMVFDDNPDGITGAE